jgi:hypothetical protein
MSKLTRFLAAALQIPALLLAESVAAVHLVALAGLGAVVPPGLHSYLPLAESIPFATLVRCVIPCSLAGLSLLALDPRWRSRRAWRAVLAPSPRAVAQGLVLVLVAQLAAYALQIAYLDQVQGVADAAIALIAAAALQASLVIFVAALTGMVALAPAMPRRELWAMDSPSTDSESRATPTPCVVRAGDPVVCAPRRGPPATLLVPIGL